MEIKKYKNQIVAFNLDGEKVNATDMIKLFPEKRINNFIRNQQTKEFIKVLETLNSASPVVEVVKGGKTQGTWMNRLLALKFAAWLSPEFEIYVFSVFDEHIKTKLKYQQSQLDYFWDKEDNNDLYGDMTELNHN